MDFENVEYHGEEINMNNEICMNFFKKMADKNPDEYAVKLVPNKNSNLSSYDAIFLKKYINSKTDILDLGAGSGLLINKIYNDVNTIVAVEPFEEFTQYIKRDEKIKIYNQTIEEYSSDLKFDLVTIFGVLQYFNEEEVEKVYRKYINYLKVGGKLIIKNQFGVEKDVIIDGYSEELKQDYYSQYRHLDKEQMILRKAGFNNFEIVDIYPPESNRWDDTHFYAIVASI